MNKKIFILPLLILLSLSFVSADLNTSLSTYFNYEETSGSTLIDVVGSNNLTNFNSPTQGASGIHNNAYDYDPVDAASNKTSASGLPTGSSDRTYNLWLQKATPSSTDTMFVYVYGTNVANQLQTLYHSASNWIIGANGASNDWNTGISVSSAPSGWFMTTVRVDSNNVSFWINGVMQSSASRTYATVSGPLSVSQHPTVSVGGNNWEGEIDEFGIWNRALNDSEISDLYNLGNGTFYPFTNPIDPNGTLTVQAIRTSNSSIISGLCATISNSTFNSSGCNSTGTDVYFSHLLNSSVFTGIYNVSIYSVGVGDGSSGSFSSNTSLNVNWTGNQTEQIFSTPLSLQLTFLDEETRNDLIGTDIAVSVIDSSGVITDFSTNTSNITIEGIFEEGDYTVRYTAENYSLRDFFFTLSFDNPLTTETLYLLRSSVFTPGVVQVRNFDGTNIVGSQVVMSRYYGNDTIPNEVQAGTTDDDGNVVFVAESVTAFYTFKVTVDGVVRHEDTTPQLLTVDNTGLFTKTIILNRTGLDEVNQNTGFSYTFTPQNSLTNNSVQQFNTTISSASWDLSTCSFSLYNAVSSSLLNSSSGFCNASYGSSNLYYNITTTDALYTELVITTSLFTNTYQQYYSVMDEGNGTFTLSDLADDIEDFSGAGFNNFTRFFISLIVILGVAVSLSNRSNFINNPEEMIFLIFVLSLGFSYIDWINLGIQNMPIPLLNQWFISLLLGLVALVMAFRKFGVND